MLPTHTTTKVLEQKKEIKLKIFLFNCLENRIYRNIFFLCYSRGFTYKNELEELLLCRVGTHLKYLLQHKIIEEVEINKEFADFLYSQEGYNYYNVQNMKIYSFTNFGRQVFSKYKELIYFEASKSFREHLFNEEITKEQIEQRKQLRMKIIMSKPIQMRTIEDQLLIQEMEKQNAIKI